MSGTTTLTLDSDWLAAGTLAYNDEIVDGLRINSGFWQMLTDVWGDAGKPFWPRASRWISDIRIGTHSEITATPSGAEALDMSTSQVDAQLVFSPAYSQAPIVISGMDRRVTGEGRAKLLTLWQERMDAVHGNMWRKLIQHLVAGGVTGYADALWNSLNGVDRTYGFLEAAAVGSQTRTVGGQSKSTLSDIPGMNNRYVAGSGGASASLLNSLYGADVEIKKRADDKTTIAWCASTEAYKFLKRATLPLERVVQAKGSKSGMDAGLPVTEFGGVKVFVEEYMPVSTTYGGSASATTPVSFYGIDFKQIRVLWGQAGRDEMGPIASGYFGVTDPALVDGSRDQFAAKKQVFGQLVASSLFTSAIVSGLETW